MMRWHIGPACAAALSILAIHPAPAISAPLYMTRPPPLPKVQLLFGALTIRLRTGGDDLRSDSQAWIELRFRNGGGQKCTLKELFKDSWGNNTLHSPPPCALAPARTMSELKAARIVLRYDGAPFPSDPFVTEFNSWDNWNVNEVHIEARTLTQNAESCLLDASGNPLVRLTGERPGFVLDQSAGC
jgi:hypothetical protein